MWAATGLDAWLAWMGVMIGLKFFAFLMLLVGVVALAVGIYTVSRGFFLYRENKNFKYSVKRFIHLGHKQRTKPGPRPVSRLT